MVRVKFEKNMKLFFSFFHNIFHSIHSLSVSAHHGNSKSDHVSWLDMIYSPLNEIRPNERWLYLVQKALNNTKHNKIGIFSVFHTFSMRTRSFEVIKVGFWKKNYFYPKFHTRHGEWYTAEWSDWGPVDFRHSRIDSCFCPIAVIFHRRTLDATLINHAKFQHDDFNIDDMLWHQIWPKCHHFSRFRPFYHTKRSNIAVFCLFYTFRISARYIGV